MIILIYRHFNSECNRIFGKWIKFRNLLNWYSRRWYIQFWCLCAWYWHSKCGHYLVKHERSKALQAQPNKRKPNSKLGTLSLKKWDSIQVCKSFDINSPHNFVLFKALDLYFGSFIIWFTCNNVYEPEIRCGFSQNKMEYENENK